MQVLRNIPIRLKMGVMVLPCVIGMLAIAVLGGLGIHEQARLLDETVNRSFARSAAIAALAGDVNAAHAELSRIIILKYSRASDPMIRAGVANLNTLLAEMNNSLAGFRARFQLSAEEQDRFDKVGQSLGAYSSTVADFVGLLGTGIDVTAQPGARLVLPDRTERMAW